MPARTTALLLGGALAAGMAATPVHAAVISYTEGTDLSGASGTPTVLGALGNGANIIHGTINCSSGCSTGDLDDYFNVTLSSVQQITNISLSITNFAQSNGAIGVANMNGSAITPISFTKNINNGANNTTTSLYAGSAPGPGTQSFHVGLSGGGSANRALSFTYEFTIDVAAYEASTTTGAGSTVPEPATLALFGSGLISLAWLRRRRPS